MTYMNYEDLKQFIRQLKIVIGENRFEEIFLTELYNLFQAEELYLFKVEDPNIIAWELKKSKYKQLKYKHDQFENTFEVSLHDIKKQQAGILKDESTGVVQKVFLFHVNSFPYLLILKQIKKSQYMPYLNFIFELLSFIITAHHNIKKFKEESVETVSDALSIFAHEIKNSISSIKAAIDTIKSVRLSEEDRNKILQIMNAIIVELTGEIDNICCKKIDTNASLNFSLKNLVEEIVEEVKPVALAKKVEIITNLEESNFTGNMLGLKKAVLNIVINAIKYNKEGGKVLIFLTDKGKEIIIKVKDTGIGIPKELQKKIFEKFVRGKHEYILGTGLGLYITKNIIEKHKGKIKFVSKPAEGTEFSVSLPKGKKISAQPLIFFLINFILLCLIGLSIYPLIPYEPSTRGTEKFLVFKTKSGSIIRVSKDSKYKANFKITLFKTKEKINFKIQHGHMEARLTKTDVKVKTPFGNFTNLGTDFSLFTKEMTGISVFSGVISSNILKIKEGKGAIVKDDIKIVPISPPVKELIAENLPSAELKISWQGLKDVNEYEVWIARDIDFSEIVKVIITDKTSIESIIPQDGQYYIKIHGVDKHSLKGMPAFRQVKNFYHLIKGRSLRDKGVYDKALREFEKSYKDFGGKEVLPLSEIAWTYYLQGNMAMAENKFKEALKVKRNHEDMVRLARVYFHQNQLEEAKKLYKEVLSENPENLDAMWGLAEYYLKENNIPEVEKYIKQVEAIDYKYPLLHYTKSRLYLLKGNKEKALAELKLELKYYPESREAKELLKEMLEAK